MDIVEEATSNSDRPAPPGQDSSVSSSCCLNEKKTTQAQKFNAVPRKATAKDNHESPCSLKYESDEEIMAPLGFEPEGSATRPSFCEGCSSLQGLLSDRYGCEVFYEYLRLQNYESLVDFWRSCEKFRQLARDRSNLTLSMANGMYAKYMHKKHVCGSRIDDPIRAKIKHKLNSGQPLTESMFDSAQEAIFSCMNEYFYGSFIRSDVYKSFVGDAVKIPTKDRVSTGRSARFTGTTLPSLPEEKVFEGNSNHGQWKGRDSASKSLGRPADGKKEGCVLQNLSKAAIAGMFCQPIPPVVSVNDSDVQSLSSDALTDESKSTVTDFSDMTSKSVEKRRGQGSRVAAGFLPRTKRLPKDHKQLPPEEFAKILIERLKKVLIEQEQEERLAANLVSLPTELFRENKKSILQDAAERHRLFQQTGQLGLGIPAQKFNEPCYSIHGNCTIISTSSHVGYVEQCPIPVGSVLGKYPSDSANGTWRGCAPDNNMSDNQQCAPLTNTKKQWESVGTIESAPDSGVCVEEDHSLLPDARNRILQWMEQGEKEAQPVNLQQPAVYTKNTRTKHASGHPGQTEQATFHVQPIAQDPLMPPLPPPDSRNTLEEASRRLTQKNVREKKSRSHHRSRPGYTSSRSSQMTCPQFSSNSADCSSSTMSGDYQPKCMYSSSSVLSSVPSTVNSKDSGLGSTQKKTKKLESTKIVYYLAGEDIPYQSTLPGNVILLGQFKGLMTFKKGETFRYFFKKKSEEEDCGAVYEEVIEDDAPLPCFNGKVICKVKEA